MSSSATTRDVHILPVGWEFDRAVLPFESIGGKPPTYYAHEFHVISEGREAGLGYPERVRARLNKIAPATIHSVLRDDPVSGRIVEFEEIVGVCSQICARAMERGDRVHINLSSGSRLIAFAAGVVAMTHLGGGRGSAYYVRPLEYARTEKDFESHGFAIGVERIQEVPLLPMILPEPLQLRVLSFLKHRTMTAVRFREILEYLREIPGSGYALKVGAGSTARRRHENAEVTKMVRTLITPLERQGLIRTELDGASKVATLEPNGRIYASLSAIDQPGLRKPIHR